MRDVLFISVGVALMKSAYSQSYLLNVCSRILNLSHFILETKFSSAR